MMRTDGIIVKASAALLLVVFMTGTTGCIVGVGNRGNPHSSEKHTLGQELMDLKTARDAGVIDPDEYEHQRRKLLEQGKEPHN